MKILVIGGGISDEREVSLKSAKAVLGGAKASGYKVEFYDWDGQLDWLKLNLSKFDAVLPILHGKGGEDGFIQKVLQDSGVPFLGSNEKVAKQCFDKQSTRSGVKEMGYLVPEGDIFDFGSYKKSALSKKPHVIKPVMGGSSIHTHIVKSSSDFDEKSIKESFEIYETLLVEEFIDGDEVTSAVLEGKRLPLVEIIPPEGQLFDYENKYNGATQELCPPKNVNQKSQNKAIEIASDIHKRLGCRHLSRTDFIISEGSVYFLETNTIPGLTYQSLYPKAAAAVGLDFPALVDYFIKLVLK